jgi:NAD(P)-dependent dehydrogenase (short-subunit alcohol dehydrogenase family)
VTFSARALTGQFFSKGLNDMTKTWLITGAASGLGRSITEVVLAAGHNVVATARRPRTLDDLSARYLNSLRTIVHDVRDPAQAESAVRLATSEFGRLDVVVNNAGYGDIRPFEQVSAEDFQALVDTCFTGVVHVTRAALPTLRAQRSGKIFQVSSVGGRMATAGGTAYHAAKWAVGGFTEALIQETAPFGVLVCALEPGSMRTNWGSRASGGREDIFPDYQPSVGELREMLAGHWGHENGDPEKVAKVILRLADTKDLPAHLLLGSDAVEFANRAEQVRSAEAKEWLPISVSTDIEDRAAGSETSGADAI